MFYSVSKGEIVHKQFEGVYQLVRTLELLGTGAYKSVTLAISGYDDVPDELYEIPKVRMWVQRLVKKRPHLFYFVDFDSDSHIHLLGCLGDVESIYEGNVLTIREMAKQGLTQADMPPKVHKFSFSEEYANILKEGISRYCDGLGDSLGKIELFNRLGLKTH